VRQGTTLGRLPPDVAPRELILEVGATESRNSQGLRHRDPPQRAKADRGLDPAVRLGQSRMNQEIVGNDPFCASHWILRGDGRITGCRR
jgi:hypothetical protein